MMIKVEFLKKEEYLGIDDEECAILWFGKVRTEKQEIPFCLIYALGESYVFLSEKNLNRILEERLKAEIKDAWQEIIPEDLRREV